LRQRTPRHQLIILRRKVRGRARLTNSDRLFFIQLYQWFPSVIKAITIIRPETLARWRRAGFRRYWRWKSGSLGGRPQTLIRRMSVDNPLWGAPRIHGELLKLGFEVARSSVASIWSSDADRLPRDGAPSCVTMRLTSPPWTCSLPPDHWLRAALCPRHRSTGAPKPCLDQRHTTSDRGMDCKPGHRGIPLE
jgi:hypothetical protein